MPRLCLSFLGAFRAELDEAPLTHFRSAKVRGLLAYLALESDLPHPRESLAALLWPDVPDASARQNLRQSLYQLRTTLGDEGPRPDAVAPFLLITPQTAQFNPKSDHQLDVTEFLQAMHARQLERAVGLYQGELLAGLHCASSTFEEWQVVMRERLHRLALDALRDLARSCQEQGEYLQARELWGRLLALEPWAEDAHRQLMIVLARSGQRGAALAQYETCCRVLLTELGVAPAAETVLLYEQLKAGETDSGRLTTVTVEHEAITLSPHPGLSSLPPQASPLIGRERELEEIGQQLADPGCRLLTLVGMGGVGKTRLAIGAAYQQTGSERYPQGVYFISLAGLPPRPASYGAPAEVEAEVAGAVARVLGLTLSPQDSPPSQLARHMREKRLLLVLDNWEHVLPAAGLLNTLLAAAPDLQVLATSREPLNLQEEWLYWVTGLDTPGDGEAREVDSYSAVRLFLQSARRTRPGFRLGDDNRRAVAHICRLVDGLPLAIEMATAWLRGMSCDELVVEIERGLDVFTSPLRNAPERHHSLRAVFEYSWQLLTAKEQRLLARLSVFRGGFSREAALTVVDATILDLTGLVAKSLLTHTVSARYALHDLVRQFAAEKLALVRDEETHTRQQHSAYYLSFMERRAMALRGRDSRVTIAEIWREADNVREAWRSAVDAGWLELLERGQESLATFYEFTGLAQEGEAALERAIVRLRALPAGKGSSLLGELLARHARMLAVLDRYQAAIREAQEAIHLGQAAQNLKAEVLGGLAWGRALMHLSHLAEAQAPLEQATVAAHAGRLIDLEARGRWHLGAVAIRQGDPLGAQAHLEAALRLCREVGDQRVEAIVMRELGLVALEQGDYNRARMRFEQALQLSREIGYRSGEGAPLGRLGNIAVLQGDYAQARVYYRQVLELSRETGHRFNEVLVLSDLADLALKLGDIAGAQAYCLEVLPLCREVDNRPIESRNLTTLARTYHLGGQDEEARRYSLRAAAIAEEKGARSEQAEALTCLGHALAGSALSNEDRTASLLIEAAGAYQRSRALWQEVNQPDRALEALAGLAAVLLAQGEARQAQAQVDQILQHLESHSLDRVVEPFRVRLTCYQVLCANGDPRASTVLQAAQALLGEQAAKIGDKALQRSFLENVPAHREIVREWES